MEIHQKEVTLTKADRLLQSDVFQMGFIRYKMMAVFGQKYIQAYDIGDGMCRVAQVTKIDDKGIYWNALILDQLFSAFTSFDDIEFSEKGGAST